MLSHYSHVPLFAIPWIVSCQVPVFMGFSRQEYWSELPFPSQVIFPVQGLKLCLFCLRHWHWQAGSLPTAPPGKCLLQSSNNRHSNWNLQYFLRKKKKKKTFLSEDREHLATLQTLRFILTYWRLFQSTESRLRPTKAETSWFLMRP